ncbi:hypothetical protein Tco_1128705, partial [Tanacetum coccineum]
AWLVDTESEPEEAPSEVEELQSLGSRIPLMGEEFMVVEPSGTRNDSSYSSASLDSTAPLSPDHPLTHVLPTPTHTRASFHRRTARMTMPAQPVMSSGHSVRKRYRGTSKLILDTDSEEDEIGEEDTDEDEGHRLDDDDHSLDDKSRSLDEDSLGLDGSEEEVVPKCQERAAPVVETAVGEPLGLGYGALRHRELAIKGDHVYNMFKVGQGSGSVPEPERPERVSTLRQPTLTTWIDPKDGIAYIDVLAYLPPAPPALASSSPEWSSGSLLVSPAPSVVPSPISSHMISLTVPSPIASPVATPTATIFVDEDHFIKVGAQLELYRSILHDHTQRLDAMPPTLFAGIDKDVRELYTRSGVVRDEIFSQRPVLTLEAWAGHVDTWMTDLSWAGYDDHRLIHKMLVQQAALQRELQEMKGRVTALEQERDRRER